MESYTLKLKVIKLKTEKKLLLNKSPLWGKDQIESQWMPSFLI